MEIDHIVMVHERGVYKLVVAASKSQYIISFADFGNMKRRLPCEPTWAVEP